MSLFPCSGCGQKVHEKLSSITWAWTRADLSRKAYRQRLCVACYATKVIPLELAAQESPWDCPVCHTDPADGLDPVYCTSFIPGIGKRQLELATCAPCAVSVRSFAQQNARELEDRQQEFGGQGPGPQTYSSSDPWKDLGYAPD